MKLPNNTTSPETLKERLEQFALGVLQLTAPMLRELESRDIALQLRRSASSAYSNYGSACVARSHADFTSKIGIAYEEADESRRWLRFLKNAHLAAASDVEPLLAESLELRAILSASHLMAKQNRAGRRAR
ncbi:MAG: four helix bundle protein [Acidimicrobiia bacterium]|nr:four helix bundle protein [Acidimicrobiia bacterium]